MKIIQTFKGSDNHMECLICDTTYQNGPRIIPQPSCKCGNILFFDITPDYVRSCIDWPFIKVEDENNWKEIVLKEIEQFGRPKHLTTNPDEKEEFDFFDFENKYGEEKE